MTATPYGFWLNRKRTVRRIREHGHAVILSPRAYGLRRSQVEAIVGPGGCWYDSQNRDQESVRGRLYRLLMEQGWIRVRGSHQSWSIQCVGDPLGAAVAVTRLIGTEWWGPLTQVRFGDLDWPEAITCKAPDLHSCVQTHLTQAHRT